MVNATVGEIEAPPLETVPVDTPLSSVIEGMLSRKFSQMGLTRNGSFVGVVSYQSIARSLIVSEEILGTGGERGNRAAELAVEKPRTVRQDDAIEDLFDILGERSYVLVHDESVGSDDGPTVPYRIITDYDIREFWREATEPFLLIEETELQIREIIRTAFGDDLSDTLVELSEGSEHLRTVDRLEDCSFAHYERFISIHWDKGFDEFFSEQRDFIREVIKRLSENRNQLFHFRIEDRDELDLDIIEFAHGYFTSFAATNA